MLLVSSGLARGLADGRTLKRDKIDVEREENLMEMKEGKERLVFFSRRKRRNKVKMAEMKGKEN